MRDDELRTRLHALADATAPPPRADLAAVVERRSRTRRRAQLRAGAAAAVAVAAVAVALPPALDRAPAGSVAAVADAPAAGALPDGDGYAGSPARGSLGGDPAFVEAVRGLSWSDPGAGATGAPPAGSQVLFAGDVPGGRWALVARPLPAPPPLVDDDELERQLSGDSVALAWLAGPPGAAPDELRLHGAPVVAEPGLPVALWDPATGTLAVVAPRGAVAARLVDGDGSPLTQLPLSDGTAVGTAPEGTATVEVLAADGTPVASIEPIVAPAG